VDGSKVTPAEVDEYPLGVRVQRLQSLVHDGLGAGFGLLGAGGHLTHGVASLRVVLGHRRQHGDVVALGAQHGGVLPSTQEPLL